MAQSFANIIKPDDEFTWNVYIPDNFNPDEPSGIVLYFTDQYPNQAESGWRAAAADKNFIWVSTKNARNFISRKKILLGLLAAPLLQSKYLIEEKRIYVSGDYSGCKLASHIAKIYPNIFSGAIYNSCEVVTWKKELPPLIDQMRLNRYIFVGSSRNYEANREINRAIVKYKKTGIENTQYKLLSELSGDIKLNKKHINDFIDYLDGLKDSL